MIAHIKRQAEDRYVTTWCGLDIRLSDKANEVFDEPARADCQDCLDAARSFGGEAHKRSEALRRGLTT